MGIACLGLKVRSLLGMLSSSVNWSPLCNLLNTQACTCVLFDFAQPRECDVCRTSRQEREQSYAKVSLLVTVSGIGWSTSLVHIVCLSPSLTSPFFTEDAKPSGC